MLTFTCPSCHKEISFTYLKPGDETTCPLCHAPVTVPADAKVSDRGANDSERPQKPTVPGGVNTLLTDTGAADDATPLYSENDHKMLKNISNFFEVFGWVVGVAIFLVSFFLIADLIKVSGQKVILVLMLIFYILFAAITVAGFLFLSRGIRLLMNLESNVSRIKSWLEKNGAKEITET